MTDRNVLTAAELITELAKIPGDTVVSYTTRDSEYGITYYEGISRVTAEGTLVYGGILSSVDDFEDEAEDD